MWVIGGHGFWGKGGGWTPGGVLKKIFRPPPGGEKFFSVGCLFSRPGGDFAQKSQKMASPGGQNFFSRRVSGNFWSSCMGAPLPLPVPIYVYYFTKFCETWCNLMIKAWYLIFRILYPKCMYFFKTLLKSWIYNFFNLTKQGKCVHTLHLSAMRKKTYIQIQNWPIFSCILDKS